MLKLNDPNLLAHIAERKAFFRSRATSALRKEGFDSESLADGLAEAAWRLEEGGWPENWLAMHGPRLLAQGRRAIKKQAQQAERALDSFKRAYDNSGLLFKGEIAGAITQAGVSIDDANKVFLAISGALKSLQEPRGPKVRPARPQTIRSAWVLAAWPFLFDAGLGMQQASRVIAATFDGNDAAAKTFYQAIRNEVIR